MSPSATVGPGGGLVGPGGGQVGPAASAASAPNACSDIDQLYELSWRFLEHDITFPSTLWSVAEIAAYYNERQNRFNRDTKLMLAHQPVAAVAGTYQYDLPQDWIATLRATWRDTATGIITPMTRSGRFQAQHGMGSAQNRPSNPTLIDDHSAGLPHAEIFPTPTADGSIELLYACTLEEMHFGIDGADPDIWNFPCDFVPFIMYGVISDMLSKDGAGQDLARAKYAEERYDEGVMLAALLLEGFLS